MNDYSYSKEISQSSVEFREFDLDSIKKMFVTIFEFYDPKVKGEILDSFCEDFYELVKGMPRTNERIWRMVITDMLFNYDEKGYLDNNTENNSIKRKQFAIIAKVILGKLKA